MDIGTPEWKVTYEEDPDKAATRVVSQIVADPPAPTTIFSKEKLMGMASVRPPVEPCMMELYDKHSLWMMQFTQAVKDMLLETLHRDFITVWGEGFRLIETDEVIPYAEDEMTKKLHKALGVFNKKYDIVYAFLSPKAKSKANDAKGRHNWFKAASSTANAEQRNIDKFAAAVTKNTTQPNGDKMRTPSGTVPNMPLG